MIASQWHHAALAVTALADEPPDTLLAAVEASAPLAALCRALRSAPTSAARARKIVASRLRATRARPTLESPKLGAALLAGWMRDAPASGRRAMAATLSHGDLEAVRSAIETPSPPGLSAATRWVDCSVRALRRAPTPSGLTSLVLDLAGRDFATHDDAARVERSLRVNGLRRYAEADALAWLGVS